MEVKGLIEARPSRDYSNLTQGSLTGARSGGV